jgi:alkylation response protein AidB-like acyl-CoA dehydrogenase
MEGYDRGKKLEKIGQRLHDTSELFNDVQVPKRNLLGRYRLISRQKVRLRKWIPV